MTVLMPGLNEQDGVSLAVKRMRDALAGLTDEFEIIVINDGSTDRMGAIADKIAAADPHVRVLHNERNLNYGVSLRRGIEAARCRWILHDAMDLPLAPRDIDKFTPLFDEADVIAASRVDRSAHSPWRKGTSWTNRLLLGLLFSPKTADLNFVQFYRREYAQAVPLISTSPAFVTPELILRAERTGRRVREVVVQFRRRQSGKAHFGKPRDILWTLRDMLRLRVHTWLRGWES